MAKTFRALVAELMMDVEKWGDVIVTDYRICGEDEDHEYEWTSEDDEDYAPDDNVDETGFDPYMGDYTWDC